MAIEELARCSDIHWVLRLVSSCKVILNKSSSTSIQLISLYVCYPIQLPVFEDLMPLNTTRQS